jgi:MFS family permease
MNSRLGWTFAITSLALFAFTLDRLVVAIALPAIRTDLGAPVAGLEWTVNAYTLSFAVLLLTGGALGDRFGRRRMFTIGVAVFTAGSAAAALAPLTAAMLSAVTPQEQGQASGAATAIRELAVVAGVAVLGLVFTAHGGYASRADFTTGFVPAMWLAAALAAAGVLAAVALPRGRGLTEPPTRCDNDARDAVSAGAAG